jgi:hypothetical protein
MLGVAGEPALKSASCRLQFELLEATENPISRLYLDQREVREKCRTPCTESFSSVTGHTQPPMKTRCRLRRPRNAVGPHAHVISRDGNKRLRAPKRKAGHARNSREPKPKSSHCQEPESHRRGGSFVTSSYGPLVKHLDYAH